ncbi:MAG: TGS domain-containing protein, partial [Candidatus Cloacimonetes bacterium]|nr:TGS domain-containing protein [Candidatus Cloacimonadota bacterium]
MALKITLPDASVKEYDNPVSPLQVAEDISRRLADAAVAAEVNGNLVDLNSEINDDASLVIHTFSNPVGKEIYWHSTAHLMAQAVKQLFPEVKVTIGPAIEQGFYYDFDRAEPFSDDELLLIENRMKELSSQNLPYSRKELSKQEAMEMFSNLQEDYKLEL